MANIDRIKATVALIEKDEEDYNLKHFDMGSWVLPPEDPDVPAFCNTTMCFAGWAKVHEVGDIAKFLEQAVVLREREWGMEWDVTSMVMNVEDDAQDFLDLTEWEAHQIFYRTSIATTANLKQHITNVLEEVIWEGYEPHEFRALYS